MMHMNGAFHDPIGMARDGYESTVGNGRTWIRTRSDRARRLLAHDDLTIVCSECGHNASACDCSASIQRSKRLITLAAFRRKRDA